jgi:hypothetical protein
LIFNTNIIQSVEVGRNDEAENSEKGKSSYLGMLEGIREGEGRKAFPLPHSLCGGKFFISLSSQGTQRGVIWRPPRPKAARKNKKIG